MKNSHRSMTAAATMIVALGIGGPAFAQATDADGYGDGYQSGAYGRVRAADDGATIVRADGERSASDRADTNAPIFPGDTVRTDRDQRVEIQLAGGTLVRIDGGAEIVFQSLPNPTAKYEDNVVLALNAGVVRITSRVRDKEEFRIDTRGAAVYLLGEGEFRIDANDRGGTSVASLRGVAEVVGSDASVLVRGGMQTAASAGSAPGTPKAYSAFSSDGFDRWCDARDDAYRVHDHTATRDGDERDNVPAEVRPYYAELSLHGSWTVVPDYGTVWSPAGVASDWRPYADGHWAYGPGGYFWVSYEPWGWAPYHYGNWQWVTHHGWCWVPGRVFAGAWVSWSWGSAYVGWAPLDFWGRPAWIGGPYYDGFYDPGCWTFVNYSHIHHVHVHRYAVPIASIRHDLLRATVVTRGPRVDPRRVAVSQEWRERALRQVADDHAAHLRPIQIDRRPERRLSDVQNQLMRRPAQVTPPLRTPPDGNMPRPRRILEDPTQGKRRAIPEATRDGVRDLYERMSRPRETRGQEAPRPDVSRREDARPQPRLQIPQPQAPRPDVSRRENAPPQPRPQRPQAQAPRPEVSRPHSPPQAKPRHVDKH